ncbi:hypothetical protein AERO9A_320140 [Aeromonas salmonicida]|nr:hypothetical protein AERO9A_320140 [Aeromonas salmonicida]
MILPSCLAIFSRRAAIFFLISFLLALAICVAPFAVVTPEVSVSLSIDVPECHKVAVWAKLLLHKSVSVSGKIGQYCPVSVGVLLSRKAHFRDDFWHVPPLPGVQTGSESSDPR